MMSEGFCVISFYLFSSVFTFCAKARIYCFPRDIATCFGFLPRKKISSAARIPCLIPFPFFTTFNPDLTRGLINGVTVLSAVLNMEPNP